MHSRVVIIIRAYYAGEKAHVRTVRYHGVRTVLTRRILTAKYYYHIVFTRPYIRTTHGEGDIMRNNIVFPINSGPGWVS